MGFLRHPNTSNSKKRQWGILYAAHCAYYYCICLLIPWLVAPQQSLPPLRLATQMYYVFLKKYN